MRFNIFAVRHQIDSRWSSIISFYNSCWSNTDCTCKHFQLLLHCTRCKCLHTLHFNYRVIVFMQVIDKKYLETYTKH